MAAMASLLRASSFVVNRDSKSSSLPLKWRNPSLRTTQISLPSSMIKNNSTTTGFIRTIKCSSSSRGSSALRVQCVMNSNFKKEQVEEEEEEDPFKRFGILKVLKALTKPVLAVILVRVLLTDNRTQFFGFWLAYDLCEAIWSISSQYSRIGKGEIIEISVGPVLCSILVFLAVLFGFGEQEQKMTLEWTPSSKKQKMTLEWNPSSKGSVDAKESVDLKRQEDPIAKGDDEEERTRRDNSTTC